MAKADGFSGSSVVELASWLKGFGIDPSTYGRGVAKSLDLLWNEVWAGGSWHRDIFLKGGDGCRMMGV
jgi:hypothetical protein